MPTSFTPNGDGRNDFFGAAYGGIDPAGFSMKIFQDAAVLFDSDSPGHRWRPTGYGKTRTQFVVEVKLRTLSGVAFDTCTNLTIPRLDTARNCWINLDGLHFSDEIDEGVRQLVYPTGERGCL